MFSARFSVPPTSTGSNVEDAKRIPLYVDKRGKPVWVVCKGQNFTNHAREDGRGRRRYSSVMKYRVDPETL